MKRLLHSSILKTPVMAIALGAVGLSGCTTMRGAPVNVLDESNAALLAAPDKSLTTPEEIISHYVGIDNEDRKREFRNRVIDHYMGQIDKQYEKYSTRLFSEGIELALGFDAAIIGLASTASLFEEVADDLATVISGFAGLKSAIDKNLYFDRTLPALIVTMDAERTKAETEILSHKNDDLADYSIEAAIRDLRRYQHAGTLMRAITKVTETANIQNRLAERDRLGVVPFGCAPSEELIDAVAPIGDYNLDQGTILNDTQKTVQQKDLAWRNSVFLATLINQGLNEKIIIPPNRSAVGAPAALVRGIALALHDADERFCKVSEVQQLANDLAIFDGR